MAAATHIDTMCDRNQIQQLSRLVVSMHVLSYSAGRSRFEGAMAAINFGSYFNPLGS